MAECSKGSIRQYLRPALSYLMVSSIFEWPLKTGFTVYAYVKRLNKLCCMMKIETEKTVVMYMY